MNGLLRALIKLNEHAIPLGLAANAVWWAFVMLHPVNVFASSPAFGAMASVMSETSWGILFAAVAVVQIAGIALHRYRIRVIGSALSTLLWFTVGGMFVISFPLTTGTGNYAIWGVLSFLSTVLVMYEKAR